MKSIRKDDIVTIKPNHYPTRFARNTFNKPIFFRVTCALGNYASLEVLNRNTTEEPHTTTIYKGHLNVVPKEYVTIKNKIDENKKVKKNE